MSIDLAGTLPLSAVNVGLAASTPALTAEVSKLGADASDLSPAVQAQIEISSHFPPSPAAFTAVLGTALATPELAACMTPGNVAFAASEANVAVAAKLGFIRGQITVASAVRGQLAGGLEAGSITGWSYSGRCNGFGPVLEQDTKLGFGGLGPADEVSGVLIVTQDFSSWGQFSKGMSAAPASSPAAPADTKLTPHGPRSGAQWNTGVADVTAHIDAFIAELEGMAANLEASLRFSVGADLPSPSVVVDAGLDAFGAVGIDGLLDNLVNVQADIPAALGAIQVDADATASLSAEIGGQLAAGGLSVWIYGGRADGFGTAVSSALASGVPGGGGSGAVVYGLAIAGAGPSMNAFGGIFKTAA